MPKSRIKLLETRTHREIPAAPESAVLQSSGSLGWHGITVELHNLAPAEMPEHFVQGHRLMVAVQAGKPMPFEWKENGSWKKRPLKTGDFSLQTHGSPNAPRWTENLKILAVALEPRFIGRVFQDSLYADRIAFQERRCESDPGIARFAAHFKNELENASYQGKLYGESLAMAFALHLLEKYGDFSPINLKMPRGRLGAANLRRALEFIHANLAEDLSIEQIARESYLSAFHFARLFKNTLGLTPHQYVLQNRIERAKHLLRDTDLTVVEIAYQSGFADQPHFTKTFRKHVGATPAVYQIQIR